MKLKSQKNSLICIATLALAASTSIQAAVTFTELPNENWGGSIAVSDNGVVAFAGDTGLYKWSQSTGVVELGSVEWARVSKAFISPDGSTISFTGVSLNGVALGGGTVIYKNGEELIVPQSIINTGAIFYPGSVSSNGNYIAGMKDGDPAFYNVASGELQTTTDTNYANFVGALAVTDDGQKQVLKAVNGYTPDTYFKEGNGEPVKVNFAYSWGMSANGQLVLGEVADCTEVETLGASLCTAVWNKDTQSFTEVGYFRPVSISRDGSFVTGNGWSDAPGAKIWDSYNGTRDLVDVLTANGVDVTGWSDFTSLTVSPDGTKFAGYGTNPAGVKKPFVINVIAECVGF